MADSDVTVSLPAELKHMSSVVTTLVSSLKKGDPWLQAIGKALPLLLAEGVDFDEIKKEVKSPRAIALAGLMLGEVVAILVEKKAKEAALVAAGQAGKSGQIQA